MPRPPSSLLPPKQPLKFTPMMHEVEQRNTLQRNWERDSQNYGDWDQLLPSSVVTELEWEPTFNRVHVMLGNRKYTYLKVKADIFDRWFQGKASCKTDDATGKKRWWIDKTPSLGAFYNKHIKGRYACVRGYL